VSATLVVAYAAALHEGTRGSPRLGRSPTRKAADTKTPARPGSLAGATIGSPRKADRLERRIV
jgi:hypothetical protein